LSENAGTPLLATLPGRLRDWANAAIGPVGAFVPHELSAEPWPPAADGVPTVVLLDELATAMDDMIALGMPPVYAAGRLAVVLTLVAEQRRAEGPHLLVRAARDDAASLCQRLRAELALHCEPAATTPDLPELRKPTGRLATELVDGFLAPLQAYAQGAVQALLHWPRASFLTGFPNHETAPERIELVGPARSLVYGPYLYLPTGWWEAELRLYFSEEACRRTFNVEMIAEDSSIGIIRLKPTSSGIFHTRMMFHNPRADWPVSLRVVLEHGAIEGRMGLEGVTLRHSRSEATIDKPYNVS
jgi:hypothetical protein